MSSDSEKVIVKYSSYTEAQKKATKKYRIENKDKVNEQRKQYYKTRKDRDPEFLTYKREKAKEYYQKKKSKSGTDTETDSKPCITETPTESIIVKPKKVRQPRIKKTVEQKKTISKLNRLIKNNIIESIDPYIPNIDQQIYFELNYTDKKGKLKQLKFFDSTTQTEEQPTTGNPIKSETDIESTDTENIILGDEHIIEDLKPESLKTPEQPIKKRTPKTPRKLTKRNLSVDI